MYFPEKGVAQLPLPFPGWRKVTNTYYQRLSDADFPCWERQQDSGHLLAVTFDKSQWSDVETFLEDNCHGRYHLKKSYVYFELKIDYAMFKIAYGDDNDKRF